MPQTPEPSEPSESPDAQSSVANPYDGFKQTMLNAWAAQEEYETWLDRIIRAAERLIPGIRRMEDDDDDDDE